mmetsp:Transcript_94461/g.249768  ORF Transcript_94461/g.249768 Transcript_94461/m.249768 type:complete len:265 (-) Transcript_94461:68-862(-)
MRWQGRERPEAPGSVQGRRSQRPIHGGPVDPNGAVRLPHHGQGAVVVHQPGSGQQLQGGSRQAAAELGDCREGEDHLQRRVLHHGVPRGHRGRLHAHPAVGRALLPELVRAVHRAGAAVPRLPPEDAARRGLPLRQRDGGARLRGGLRLGDRQRRVHCHSAFAGPDEREGRQDEEAPRGHHAGLRTYGGGPQRYGHPLPDHQVGFQQDRGHQWRRRRLRGGLPCRSVQGQGHQGVLRGRQPLRLHRHSAFRLHVPRQARVFVVD